MPSKVQDCEHKIYGKRKEDMKVLREASISKRGLRKGGMQQLVYLSAVS